MPFSRNKLSPVDQEEVFSPVFTSAIKLAGMRGALRGRDEIAIVGINLERA